MTRWDTDNLNAAHTVRELQQEFGCNLVDRLREVTGGKLDYTNTSNALRLKAADKIEQLERELAEARKGWLTTTAEKSESIIGLNEQLDAEKALADQGAERVSRWIGFDDGDGGDAAFLTAYRKIRAIRR